jgi:hypothetical protein
MNKKVFGNCFFLLPFLLVALLLGGCATPVDKSEITPKLYSNADKNIALAVIEARPYVVTGNKTPKFEGIVRGGFGVPLSVDRPNRPAEERFVDYLAGMIKDGMAQAGAKVTVLAVPVNASLEDTLAKMAPSGASRYVVLRVLESNWDMGGISGMLAYKYDFSLFVAGPGGFQTQGKNLAANEANKASDKYNVFDMHSVRYREILETLFADPAIRSALLN